MQRDVNVYWKSLFATYAFGTNQMTAKRAATCATGSEGRPGEGRERASVAEQANCYGHVSGQRK